MDSDKMEGGLFHLGNSAWLGLKQCIWCSHCEITCFDFTLNQISPILSRFRSFPFPTILVSDEKFICWRWRLWTSIEIPYIHRYLNSVFFSGRNIYTPTADSAYDVQLTQGHDSSTGQFVICCQCKGYCQLSFFIYISVSCILIKSYRLAF